MDHHRLMLGLLVALMSLAVLSRLIHPAALPLTAQMIWNGYLSGSNQTRSSGIGPGD